ncbi:hypothetical protein D1007_02574 [Hordeum vulgare]|nr:hypothetical protein D1007_02574 [Hordeum vulgare]
MYLERLRNGDVQFSWGSTALAYLYRQLDQASMRTKDSSSLCGFVWSLSMWMWEWLPVGRPMLKNPDHPNPNPHEGLHHEDPYRRPTVAYHWDQVSVYTGSFHLRYKCYVNELGTLTAEHVRTFQFLVLYVFVTAILERVPNLSARPIVVGFWRPYEEDCQYDLNQTVLPGNLGYAKEYLVWYAEHYRLKLKPGWTREEWFELVSEDPSAAEGYHAFNMVVRETGGSQVDYAPMHDELGRESLLCVNNANVALSHPPGGASSERTLRTALEKFRSRFHKWAAMLSCHGAQSVDVFTGGTSRSSRIRRRQMTIDDIEEEEEEETIQDHEVDIDAPQPSQPSQPSQSRKKKTPRVVRKKKLSSRLHSPEYSRKNLPKGMQIEEEEDEEDIEEEEAEGEESSKEEEEEVPTRKGKAAKRGRKK